MNIDSDKLVLLLRCHKRKYFL